VTFSDGTPFDAAAVMAHWTRMQDPATASPGRADAAEIASMQAPDTSTVKVTLAAPDATWRIPLATANLSWIPSPTAVAKFGATFGTTPESTVGAGPFLLKELVFSDHQTYVRNPNYWDKPKPYLDSMTFKTFFDPQTRYNTFVSGGADAIENISAAQTNVDLDKSYASISTPPLGGGYGFAFNMKTGPTADVDVRQAMMYAVDMKAVLTRAAPGQLFAPSLFDRDAPWFANIPLPYDNLKKAQQHLDAYLQRTGQQSTTVDIVMPTDFATIMDALKQEWAKLKGLNVNVAIETAVQTASRIARRDYPGGLVQSIAGTPRAALNQFLSGAPANTAFLSDPAMDAAVKKANETTNPAQVKAAMNTVAERYNALLPYMMIARLNSSVWVKPYVKDAKTDPVAVTLWRSQDMWRSKP
jgi:peptide/nickel transport system substrate-binding protein